MAVTISKNKMNFIKDGKPFLYLADTCWSAFTNIHATDWEYYLQYRKRQGYNVLQINILPQWDASATDLQYSPYYGAIMYLEHGLIICFLRIPCLLIKLRSLLMLCIKHSPICNQCI